MEGSQKVYDLEERTFLFNKNIRLIVKKLETNIWNKKVIIQVAR
jgi:hypothetical protein